MGFQIPTAESLEKLRGEADAAIDSVTKILDNVDGLGAFLDRFPFLPQNLRDETASLFSAARTIDRDLKLAKAFLDHLPI